MATFLLVLLLLVPGAELQDECQGNSCNPQLGDLMVGRAAQLAATSTCGLDGPQSYCIIGYLEDEQKCFTCDSRQPYNIYSNPNSHRIENVITTFDPERRMKWWQSEHGVQRVSVQLDLETLFQFSHLVLTFKSFRPAAMLVERSKDYGQTWKVFRYFAEDCTAHFPWVSAQPADSVDDVVCDSRYSGSEPSTDGEVVLKALDPTFDIEDPYAPHIQELITMTNIRVNFTRLFTLGDTLLGRRRRNPQEKYYYALYDMVVRGSCFCNGHAGQCMPVDGTRGDVFNELGMVHGRCVCQHNTVGNNCERCQDFYNDTPWRPGGEHASDACRRCNCHGHSEACHFDAARYEATGQVSGGVCDGCQHGRVGPRCEECRPFLYQDPRASLEDPQGCIPCDCDPMGSLGSGLCNPLTGQCVCKENVEGERCDRCKFGFFGLTQEDPSGCQVCRCNALGSVQEGQACDQETGECVCDRLATGPLCDQCVPGYWGLGNTVQGCAPCDCNIGGARDSTCAPIGGQCDCLPNMVGRTCAKPAPGYFLPFLDYFLYEAENAAPLSDSSSLVNPTYEPQVYPTYPPEVYPTHPPPVYPTYPPQVYPTHPPQVYPTYPPQVYPTYGPQVYPTYPPQVYPTYPPQVYPTYPPQVYPTYPPQVYPTYPPQVYPTYPPQVYPTYPPQVYPTYPPQVYPTYPPQVYPTYPPQVDPTAQPQVYPSVLPQCEKYYREQGYDLKYSDGRIVLVRRTKRHARRRRQGQSPISLDPGSAQQIIPRERSGDRPVTWTGPGFVRILDFAGLRFTVDNIPTSMDYNLVIRYEPETPGDWLAAVSVLPLSPGDGSCADDPIKTRTLKLAGNARGSVLDTPLCLNAGARYFVDVTFKKQPNSHPTTSSHILIDSMGLIPQIEAVQDFCSQSDLDSFRQFRCMGLAVELGTEEPLPQMCEDLIGSMSARIHNGAVPCGCNVQGSLGRSCSKLGGLCECRPHVIGRCCDSCAPQTFGFGPNGCTPCDCDPSGSVSALCDQVRGQCPCRREVAGRRCEQCQPGYWGFPLCRPCECNGQAELCQQDTGACLDCRGRSAGHNCERCMDGYYGDPVSREPCEPCLCPDTQASGRFFASSCNKDPESHSLTCNCLNGYTGSRCDACAPGFYGDLTVTGARCEECPCNNNIDPDAREACDSVTGQCVHCLYNTHGLHCQSCKPGYYGDALAQDCKECSCDRRGTEVTRCPLGSPCFCDPVTGQCPCRVGATGVLCDECDDGYWNIQGASGCQPCNCDPANALNNICDKGTGQCQCRPEFGGQYCDDCGENHFGNPDLQCVSCDCNLEGTERPSCDADTGECLCRVGVTGIFCDECAPGYDSVFPACAPCHPCAKLWAGNVTDVQRAAQRMRTLIPLHGDHVQPAYQRRWQRILEMHSKLDWFVNVTGRSLPLVEEVEELCLRLGKLKDSIDPNLIVIDPSTLLDIEIDNIRHEFKKLFDNLKDKITDEPEVDVEEMEDALDEIKKLHKKFMAEEKRVRNAKKGLEDSMDTRQEIKEKLASCSSGGKGDMGPLEKKILALSVKQLNEDICGAPSHEDCSKSDCGGALCRDALGERECGGPKCRGSVPLSQNATETAEHVQDNIIDFLHELKDAKIKIEDIKQMTVDTKDLADELQDRIVEKKEKAERDKNETKQLIQRVKEYLLDEMVSPEDIEKMARAVLAIQLPKSPGEIQSMIDTIKDLLSNIPDFKKDLKDLEDQAEAAKDLLEKAKELKDSTKDIDVTEIKKDIYDAEAAQDKANDSLEKATGDKDMAKNQIDDVKEKLDNVEENLSSPRPKDLLDAIEALKNKTEMNREQAEKAKADADAALANATDAGNELEEVQNLFDILKEKNTNQTLQDEANERVKNITMDAAKIKQQVEDKLKQIEDMEKKIQDLIKKKDDRVSEVSMLLEKVESLREEIAKRADVYTKCSI